MVSVGRESDDPTMLALSPTKHLRAYEFRVEGDKPPRYE
jgi:hypothetical protein